MVMQWWLNLFLKFFFLLTPFFVLSSFISITADYQPRQRKLTALKMTAAVILICGVLFLFGSYLFDAFGITIESFQVGTGVLLMLTAISLVRGGSSAVSDTTGEIAVVPLAIPLAVGPGTIGALMVLSVETNTAGMRLFAISAIIASAAATGGFCFFSDVIRKILGKNGLAVLSKLTGLIISSLAARLILSGIKNSL